MDNFQKQANLNLILSLNGASWNVSKATRDIIKVWKWSLQKKLLRQCLCGRFKAGRDES